MAGVWKLAFADFMTAMMTFFLVMWLVNSASKEKIIQLANYFNPVKLSDRTPPAKGVRDNQKSGAGGRESARARKPSQRTRTASPAKSHQRPRSMKRRICSAILSACSRSSLRRRRARWPL